MANLDDTYCERCVHGITTYGKRLCTAFNTAIPVESARHPKGSCGPDALLFDPKGIDDLELDYG